MSDIKPKVEQIVREGFVKIVQLVLQCRIELPATGKMNKWFNLGSEEVDSITEEILPWRQDIYSPLLLSIFMHDSSSDSSSQSSGGTLLERWKIFFDRSSAQTTPPSIEVPTLYKKAVVLIRTLYSTLRLLPANRLIREIRKHKSAKVSIRHHCSSKETLPIFPNTASSEFKFGPLETPFGRFNLSVNYRTECNFKIFEDPMIMSKFFIYDYKGEVERPSAPICIPGTSPPPVGTLETAIRMVMSPPNSITTLALLGASPAAGAAGGRSLESRPVSLADRVPGAGVFYSPPPAAGTMRTSGQGSTVGPSMSRSPDAAAQPALAPASASSSTSPSTSPPVRGGVPVRHSPRSTMLFEPSGSFLDPAFASTASGGDGDGEVGDFVRFCGRHPALKVGVRSPRAVAAVTDELQQLAAAMESFKF